MPRARWLDVAEDVAEQLAGLGPEALDLALRRAADRIKARRADLPKDVWRRLNGAARAVHFGSDQARGIERRAA